jgi:hypothetical protein
VREIQLSYSTLRDILNDESLSENMVVYALSLASLGDCGGSYYEIVTKDKMPDPDNSEVYKLRNGYYAKSFKTNTYEQDLIDITEVVVDTEQLLENVRGIVGEVEDDIGIITEKINKLESEINENLETLDGDADGIAECVGELCDECLTLYSKALQLKNTSMGDINLVDLVPIIDSDVNNVAANVGELMDTDYSLAKRIKKLEDKMKELDPDFDPDAE